MKLTYSIDTRARLVRLHYTGNPSFEEWESTVTAVLRDPDYRPGFAFLADRRHLESPTADYIRSIIDFIKDHPAEFAGGRWTVVVGGPASYGMVRMAQALGEGIPVPIQVFTDIDEAERWLRSEDTPDAV